MSEYTIPPAIRVLNRETIDRGRLRFVEVLGEGGYGVVYRATDETSPTSSSMPDPKQYAVKALLKAEYGSRRWQYHQNEIAAHKLLTGHRNVLTLHDIIDDDKYTYLILDYCSGGDLFSAISEKHQFAGNDALVKDTFLQIIDGVQACHNKGIFHRDLKPDNIFCVDRELNKIVIGDFGLATAERSSDTFGCGSAYYMSPECIGQDTGYRTYDVAASDVWSLGVILTNMLVGRNPWNFAQFSDDAFFNYVEDNHYLIRTLPISKSAWFLLNRMFTWSARDRVGLDELRQMVLDVDTFFMKPQDIAKSNRVVQEVASTYLNFCTLNAKRSDEVEAEILVNLRADALANADYVAKAFSETTFIPGLSTGSDSSSRSTIGATQSIGPETPPTHAQDAATALIEVPDYSYEECIGEQVLPDVGKGKAKPAITPIEPLAEAVFVIA